MKVTTVPLVEGVEEVSSPTALEAQTISCNRTVISL
jgi:hypothetical protein